jgi:trans-aconitate methyltransferase
LQWNPEEYARNSSNQLEWARGLIERLALVGDEALLDVGCGDGKITAEIAKAVPQGFVLGVDASAAFIEYARSHYSSGMYPHLLFEEMDAQRLEYPRKFDIIFSNAALHWARDHRAFLAGCAKLLKPGGRLIISCGGRGNAADIQTAIDRVIGRGEWAGYFEGFEYPYFFYGPDDYEVWLPEAGLNASRLALVEKDMIHAGDDGLAGWLRTTWLPYTLRIPEERREAFIKTCVDAYLGEHPLDGDGKCHVRMIRLEVEARRA